MTPSLLDCAREIGARESGLATVFTGRADASFQASVVNAGVLDHPVTGEPVVGFVVRGGARKLTNLRLRPRLTVVFRSGWEWVAVEGTADIVGPDDLVDGIAPRDVLPLLRAVYAAGAGGRADDWAELNSTFAAEGQTAVLVRPLRIYSNPST